MKRKTSQKTRLSCQTDLVVRSSRQGETIFRSFRASSYLVKFLGIVTRVVLDKPFDLGTAITITTRYRTVPQSYCGRDYLLHSVQVI